MKKNRKLLNQWVMYIQIQWAKQHYVRAILAFLALPIIVALFIILIITGISAIAKFLRYHYSQLIMAALGLWAFAGWWDYHKREQLKRRREERIERERMDYIDRLEVAKTKDATYTEQAKILYSVSRELGALGIVPPTRLSNLYSPSRIIPQRNGTVNLNLYLLQKDRETVDTELVRQTLQTKCDQRLMAGEFPGIQEQYIYRNRVYSGFIIHAVRDSEGGYLEIYTVLTDDSYCRYLEQLDLNNDALVPPVDYRDIDY